MDVATGLVQLNTRLPLAERQASLPKQLRQLHQRVLQWFADHGSPPTAENLDLDERRRTTSLTHLSERDLAVSEGGIISGACPFAVADTPHRVLLAEFEVGAMSSLDALAIAPLFGRSTLITSTCAVTGSPVDFRMAGSHLVEADPDTTHIGIGLQDTRGCAATSLCRDMVFLSDEGVATR